MKSAFSKKSEREKAIENRGAFMLPHMTPGDFGRLIAIGASDPNRGRWQERMQK
jgi:hypothetical protein